MKIAFIGYGNVGAPLASHPQRLGHDVTLAANDPSSETVKKALAKNGSLTVATPKDAVKAAEVVFLATPFRANVEALKAVEKELIGKILVDCTNPVGPGLSHGLNNAQSGAYPAFNAKPVMMYCGRDPAAKTTVGELIAQLGWEPLDVGGLEQHQRKSAGDEWKP